MKRKLPAFFAGMLTMLLICSLTVSALAISGRMTLEVEPINVMVNGEVFQPKDGLGRDVPVFVYNGTTYAPLRALAEAYGLEVGYDKAQNLATVTDPRAAQASTPVGIDMDYSDWSKEEEKAYQEFISLWTVSTQDAEYGSFINLHSYDTEDEIDTILKQSPVALIEKFCARFDNELYNKYERPNVVYHYMKKGTWGWQDTFSDGDWDYSFGYGKYAKQNGY